MKLHHAIMIAFGYTPKEYRPKEEKQDILAFPEPLKPKPVKDFHTMSQELSIPLAAERHPSVFLQSNRIALKILTSPDVIREDIETPEYLKLERAYYESLSVAPGWRLNYYAKKNQKHYWIVKPPHGEPVMLDVNNCLDIDVAWGKLEVVREERSKGTHKARARAEEDEFLKLAEKVK